MLSDEEKEAIEWLKRLVKINKRDNLDDTFAEILLNLIEKQSKEIEELKEENRVQRKQLNDAFNRGWIHEDKIKAKIEEYKKGIKQEEKFTMLFNANHIRQAIITELQSLLKKE